MPPEASDWTKTMVEDRFGMDFALSVFEADPGTWSGPMASAYGYHLVFVCRHSAARVPDFADVAHRVATDLDTARRSGALDRIYTSVRDAYEIEVEPVPSSTSSDPSHLHDHIERTRACARLRTLRNAYFGELHVHTAWSLDAFVLAALNGPDEAFRFAKGEASRSSLNNAEETRLRRPLDFAAVAPIASAVLNLHDAVGEVFCQVPVPARHFGSGT